MIPDRHDRGRQTPVHQGCRDEPGDLRSRGLHETIVPTGRHFDHQMSEVFFEELGLPRPEHNLGVGGGGHGAMTGSMLQVLKPLPDSIPPTGSS